MVTLNAATVLDCRELGTRGVNEALRAVHTRMPAILKPAAFKAWLDPEQTDAEQAVKASEQHAVDDGP